MLWDYWGTTRFAPVPCSKPVAGPHAGTVPMGPLAAKHAGFGTGHGNGGRPSLPPIPNPDCAPGCVVGGRTSFVADPSRNSLEVCALAGTRVLRWCAHRIVLDWHCLSPLRRLGRLDRCRVGQQFRNLQWSTHIHHMFGPSSDGDHGSSVQSVCLSVCLSARVPRPRSH